jgi:hypothetical protein
MLSAAILSTLALGAPAERATHINVGLVDLTRPGAMESLKESDPRRFARVVEALEKHATMPCKYAGPYLIQTLPPDAGHAACGAELLTSFPAKRRVSVWVDDTIYEAIVTMRDSQGTLRRAANGKLREMP